MTIVARRTRWPVPVEARSVAFGVGGAAGLLAVYLAIIGLAQGLDHAFAQLAADAPYVGLIAAGFGTQLALFAELRTLGRHHRGSAAMTAAGTGMSATAMLACCAHHLVEVLPIVGLSAAAVFLNDYKTPLFVVAIGMNVAGIVVIARQLQRARRACSVIDAGPDKSQAALTSGS